MHPMLKPALRRSWRDRGTVQFGAAPAHAVVVGPVDTASGSFLDLLDGTRALPLLRREAGAYGLSPDQVDTLVERLVAAGLVDDPTAGGPEAAALRSRTAALERLRPDLASLSVVHPEPGAAMERLAARRALRVQVRGAGRVGATVASVLSAAGVGTVDVLDGGRAEPWDLAPGGLDAACLGERRDVAARRAVRHAAPDRPVRASGTAPGGGPPLSLVVCAPRDGLGAYAPDPAVAEDWLASGTPHLYAGVIEGTGVVGPLVLPGVTACAGCLALGRQEREPAWPRMLAQWRSGRAASAVAPCDVALGTAVAGLAAGHALALLDGDPPVSAGTRLECVLPSMTWHSVPITARGDCGCGAAGNYEGERVAAARGPQVTMTG
ncbi:ThiF family adenylyltransferase [Streptomyces sp. GC420]|uniref:ThiF family adenylyltransferase n=1 Tax=Streptomyces sp. GC420 TaxID=2697568 RepID=UPI001414EA63|nr:ThiF family adenylyltransferase [Streptomyces sp. GC420]NBM16066.1 ThiF family adenylyltransferase [Streptomyces sp. GC420]